MISYRDELTARYCSYRVRTSTDFFLDALMEPLGAPKREAGYMRASGRPGLGVDVIAEAIGAPVATYA